ncbi:helix-turn-helix domain-containing protein [Thiomicrorhabdus xiamenensis]|uniref:Helix-turn-helix transcriptional regulator n=1 Tax=Thiomicrorhabdus xiamenensis TaxID=2739063 RepID=A0A7D4NQK0_9GAMM|nr:helix-turn-helix transcriptional regulator [Thiomicrorhabdus xiamenensis]QKI88932.1 helix-turn-helix transcriptional regulator [Thiomicrorhabdus xiamenensis]
MKLHERVKFYIEWKGITKKRVAEVAGVTQSALYRFLNGSSTMKSSHLQKINEEWPELIAFCFDVNPHIAMEALRIDSLETQKQAYANKMAQE